MTEWKQAIIMLGNGLQSRRSFTHQHQSGTVKWQRRPVYDDISRFSRKGPFRRKVKFLWSNSRRRLIASPSIV